MARISFTPVRTKIYRAFMMTMQDRLHEWAEYIRNNDQSKVYVADAIQKFAVRANLAGIKNAQVLTGVTPTGTYVSTVTFTVANGVITAIALA